MEIKFEGLGEMRRDLKRILKEMPAARDRFLNAEAEILLGRAKMKTPVDTGHLRYNFKRTNAAGGEVEVYNNAEYAQFVEYGHRVKMFGRFTGGYVPGRYMLRDAVNETAAQFGADAAKIFGSILK